MSTRANRIERLAIAALIAGLLPALLCLPAVAVPQIETYLGGQSPWYSAELNAQGNTGAAIGRGGFSNILNPAGLAWAAGWRMDVGAFLVRHEEDRFMPVFDTFETRVTDMVIASNQKSWLGGSLAAAMPLDVVSDALRGGVVGFSLVERYPFRYLFEEEIRDPSPFSSPRDRILSQRRYEVTGVLRTASLGLAGALLDDRLAAGASLHYAFGGRDERRLVRDNDLRDGDQSFDERHEWEPTGLHATFGVQGRLSDRLTLGLAYETRLEVDGDGLTVRYAADMDELAQESFAHALRYPAYWRGGMAFYPRSDPRTIFTADVVYADWSQTEGSRLAATGLTMLQEVFDVRLGVEHIFYNQARLRFGFRRYDSYGDRDGGNSVFSAGAGWPWADGQLSVSLELNKLQSVLPHIFEYPSGYYAEDVTRVDDRRLRLGFSWSRSF